MGTDKRERQKANRQLKLQEMAKEARRRKTKRRALQIGIGVPVAIGLVFLLVNLFSDDSSPSKSATDVGTATTIAGQTDGSSDIATTVPAAPLPCPATDGSATKTSTFPAAPTMCIDTTKTYTVTVETSKGSYTAVLDAKKAPLTVNSFVYLARYHYFDNTPCHRIIPSFVIQCGDPTGSGTGGPGYEFADELPAQGEYKVGSLAMANSGPNTNGSQFFVVTGDQGVALPPSYTLFGQVTDGLDTTIKALDAEGTAGAGTPKDKVTINKVTVTES